MNMSAGPGLVRQRSMSNRKPAQTQLVVPRGKETSYETIFEPCAATDAFFVFAQGSTVVCLHHETLAIERRFSKHSENIQFIAVDSVSERGAGRLVVTYDVGKTAIIWDLFTGEQVSRFASYEPLTVASWMRNGNIAFGNEKGEVILFEPSTSEHISARTIFDPITALAPSSDCKHYAIGYRNGSILLAALQPSFTILHTLTTTRQPSPITTLTWHASSSKQKSDMLATQTSDGDLRVWSVSKPPAAAGPRVIRVLKRSENFVSGRNWMSWSRNGRILQFSDGMTWAWDVRTKDVTYEVVSTIEYVQGIASYGPTGSLFTLGPDYTIQQYEVDTGRMIANVRHMPMSIPPTPPEDTRQMHFTTSESEGESGSSGGYGRFREEPIRTRSTTPPSTSRRYEGVHRGQNTVTPVTKTDRSGTAFSQGVQQHYASHNLQSPTSSKHHKGSRLKQEVVTSPEEPPIADLFPFTRARLSDLPYRAPRSLDEQHMTPDDLRRQMLSVVFGWDEDIDELIQDELSRHSIDSPNAVYLTKWLDGQADHMAEIMGSTAINSTLDWMMLALSTLDNNPETKKVGQVFVEKMLSKNDVHAAVAVLLAMGDRSDAIEVYVSRNHFLEAILLASLLMPTDWQRQSHLTRRWGEHVVQNSQQHLAIRCFSCTGVEPTDAWTSPTAQMVTQMSSPALPVVQLDIYRKTMDRRGLRDAPTPMAMAAPPTPFRNAAATGLRITPQTSALKLITSFGAKADDFRFPGLKTDDRTPTIPASVTPIAESAVSKSALSPGGLGSYRLNNMRSLNSALSSKTFTLGRTRLASIGETPIDVELPAFPSVTNQAPAAPADLGSEIPRSKTADLERLTEQTRRAAQEQLPLLLTSARYNPEQAQVETTPQTAVPQNAKKMENLFDETEGHSIRPRGTSRSRKPEGLSIKMMSVQEVDQDLQRQTDSGEALRRPVTAESYLGGTSKSLTVLIGAPTTGNSLRDVKSPTDAGRSLDQYISSLQQAQQYSRQSRQRERSNVSKQAREDVSEQSASDHHKYASSENPLDRDAFRVIPASKRSPSSPVPMSPDDLRMLNGSVESFGSLHASLTEDSQTRATPTGHRRRNSNSTAGAEGRNGRRSRSRHTEGKSRTSKHATSRNRALEDDADMAYRGRAMSRNGGSLPRSPSSPLPMVPSEEDLSGRSTADSALRLVSQNRQRLYRSTSRRPDENGRGMRDTSMDGRKSSNRARSRHAEDMASTMSRKNSITQHRDHLHQEQSDDLQDLTFMSSVESLGLVSDDLDQRSASNPKFLGNHSKQLAQAELEARRLSLAQRTAAPTFAVPGSVQLHNKPPSTSNGSASARPTTPRAMTHPNEDSDVPQLPTLASEAYRPPRTDSMSSPAKFAQIDTFAPTDIPDAMPRHPAFDSFVMSRDRHRSMSQERGRATSREPPRNEGSAFVIGTNGYHDKAYPEAPPIIPELQHLAEPPPPPPPPSGPVRDPRRANLALQTGHVVAASIPLSQPAHPADALSPSSSANGHRRSRSGNENSNLMGKIRNMTERMRSSSRGREHQARGSAPHEDAVSPYESLTMSPIQLAPVMEMH